VKVKVVSVERADDGALVVAFTAPCGIANARWRGEGIAPQVERECDVELDVSVTADRAINTKNTQIVLPSLLTQVDTVLLRGGIEGVDEDGLAYLRIASDCLLMIDTAGGISVGDVVEICVPSSALSITPTGI
jgi:hypothetical protein